MELNNTVSVIVAMADNRVIGHRGKLPWNIPEDLQWFKQHTVGKPIIMGRKTFESIGRVLPDRKNIVITSQTDYLDRHPHPRLFTFKSIADALIYCDMGKKTEVMIIGGSSIYQSAISLGVVSKYYITRVASDTVIQGDTFFPEVQLYDWKLTYKEPLFKEGRLICRFEEWEKDVHY